MTELEALNAILLARGLFWVKELPDLDRDVHDAACSLRVLNTMRFVVRGVGEMPACPEQYTGALHRDIAPLVSLCAAHLEGLAPTGSNG